MEGSDRGEGWRGVTEGRDGGEGWRGVSDRGE